MVSDIVNYTSGLMQADVEKWLDMMTIREDKDADGVLIFSFYQNGELVGTRHEGMDVVFTETGKHRLIENLLRVMPTLLKKAVVRVG